MPARMNTDKLSIHTIAIGGIHSVLILVIAISGWRLWPEWQKYRAMESLVASVNEPDGPDFVAESGIYGAVLAFHDIDELVHRVRQLDVCERVMPRLVPRAHDASPRVRWRAVHALVQLGKADGRMKPKSVMAAEESINDDNQQVAFQAAHELADIDPTNPRLGELRKAM